MRILVSGMSGAVGLALLPALARAGHSITRLLRRPAQIGNGSTAILWDPLTAIDPAKVDNFDAVIHLAGESIASRWNETKKKRIRDSRVIGTRNLVSALAGCDHPPKVFLSGSAVGYYGDRGNELLTEDSKPGSGFLAEVCQEWEAATEPAAQAGIRVANLRFGMILSPEAGALPKMLPPFRMGVGGRVASGNQYMSWVAVDDVVGVILYALGNDILSGPINVTSPNPVTNADFTKILSETLHRPAMFPMPVFAARLAFGEMANELLLASQRVVPAKLTAAEYIFRQPELGLALRDMLHPTRSKAA